MGNEPHILVSHEVPISMLQESQKFNDYDYCLVHHYLKYAKYREYFLSNIGKRQVILDNSVVELGESFDTNLYIDVIAELRPNIVIAPDNFIEPEKNLELLLSFKSRRKNCGSLIMGVPHGNTLSEYLENYTQIQKEVDVIGISVHPFMDRSEIISTLLSWELIDQKQQHHLLGCQRPQEFSFYKDMPFIVSLDTSNPIIHGFYGHRYTKEGLDYKLPQNIDTIIDAIPTQEQMRNIYYNISQFKSLLNGN